MELQLRTSLPNGSGDGCGSMRGLAATGCGAMFDATGNDQQLAFFQPDLPVPEIHPESSLHHQEQLVLIFVMMPDKLALELDEFDLLTVQLADDFGTPVVVKLGELLLDIYFFH